MSLFFAIEKQFISSWLRKDPYTLTDLEVMLANCSQKGIILPLSR
jgi:hypothetical protein